MKKSSAHYQRLYRERLREQGLIKKEIWILPEYTAMLNQIEQQFRQVDNLVLTQSQEMMSMEQTPFWQVSTLFSQLKEACQAQQLHVDVQLLEGTEPIIHVVMHDFGDLPLFIAVAGEQIIVEGTLWPETAVKDVAGFNDLVLRTHQLFPLSNIGIHSSEGMPSYYVMYGSLNCQSRISSVITEILVLADNIIKATEAYEAHLFADV